MESAGRSRGGIISDVVVAIAATHRAHAMVVRAANDSRNVNPAVITLQRRIQLMAVEAARILENGTDLVPCGEACGLVSRWSSGASNTCGGELDGDRRDNKDERQGRKSNARY